jgi:hypothetical protein
MWERKGTLGARVCDEAVGTGLVPLAEADAVVNEPDGVPLDWEQVNWRSESGKNWGRLRGQFLVIGGVGEVGVPAVEVVGELVVEDPGAYLEE